MSDRYRICERCVSDTTIPFIHFDESGVCKFCKIHDKLEEQFPLNEVGQATLQQLLDKIRNTGKRNRYDCVVGVSGGTDSTYSLYMAKKLGLRPLAVHFDNGWNSEIAEQNIKNAVERLGVTLRRVTCNWEEFRDLQIAFLKASVPEAEIPTDVAIHAVLCQVAAQEGIRYVLNGHSFRTEGIAPIGWTYMEGKYIKSISRLFGAKPLKTFPNLTISDMLYYVLMKRIRVIPILNYFDYSKEEAGKLLQQELGWTYYGGHHFESVYTHFIMVYLHIRKFNIDKRLINFSAHIRSGKMNRSDALDRLKTKPSIDQGVIDHCVNKLGLDSKEFEQIMSMEPKMFTDYPTYYPLIKKLRIPIKMACAFGFLPQIFYEKYLG